jgi:hypothetical protein
MIRRIRLSIEHLKTGKLGKNSIMGIKSIGNADGF